MRKTEKKQGKQSDWVKVGPCLYRYRNAGYYALCKVKGKQVRTSLETQDLVLARRKLATFKSDLEKTNPALKSRQIKEQIDTFLQSLTGAPSTRANVAHFTRIILAHFGETRPLSKINNTDCRLILAENDHLSASTKNSILRTMRSLFAMAVSDGVLATNPTTGISPFRKKKPIRLVPTEEQFEAIVADLRSQKANGHGCEESADAVELSGRLGLGQAELAGICRKHIDMEDGVIQILRKKTSSAFTIPIYPAAREIIERRLAAMPDEPEARLLPSYNFRMGLTAACRRLNYPHFEPRALRRFFITKALRAGIDAPTVASWQGHIDGGALVLRVYGGSVRMDHSKAMAQKLAPKPVGGNVIPFEKEGVA